jgi:hypothetical protein
VLSPVGPMPKTNGVTDGRRRRHSHQEPHLALSSRRTVLAARCSITGTAYGDAAGQRWCRGGRRPYRPSGEASGDGTSSGDAICLTSFVVRHQRLRQRVSMFEAPCGSSSRLQVVNPLPCVCAIAEPAARMGVIMLPVSGAAHAPVADQVVGLGTGKTVNYG